MAGLWSSMPLEESDVPEPDLPELDFTPVPKRTVAPREDDGFEEAD